ncbi:MAG: glycosyltransferase [Balneolales bacterium]
MKTDSLNIVIIGLSLSSSWGNGHATTYRSLVKGLFQEGHQVTFLERDAEWYAANRDLNSYPYCQLFLYKTLGELKNTYPDLIKDADMVMVGSYLKEGVSIGDWVTSHAQGITAFYDIDTPITLAKLDQQDYEYIHPELIPKFNMYLSFSGGEILNTLVNDYKAPLARPLYCSVDPDLYYPENRSKQWQIGYLGTYSPDRQPTLDKLLLETAKRRPEDSFVVGGPQYPPEIAWPVNVERIEHLSPKRHCGFYNSQQFTLNVTRDAMIEAGYSPSVRLFEAAACATPIISDYWAGLETFFEPDQEILIAESTKDVQQYLNKYSDKERETIGLRARDRVLKEHTSRERARQLIRYVQQFEDITV